MRQAVGAAVVLVLGCATTMPPRDVQIARRVHYDAAIDVVFEASLASVQARSQHVEADANAHRIRTAWSSVGVEQSEGEFPSGPGGGPGPRAGTRSVGPGSRHPHAYRFVRVDVEIVGDRPYEVRITGHASRMVQGAVTPEPLADEPPWLTTYVDDLRLAIYDRLEPYAR